MKGHQIRLNNVRQHLSLYLFIFPCLLFIGTFNYYPVIDGAIHSLYIWDGGDVERFVGLKNYQDIFFRSDDFWRSFKNVLILGGFNILKMAPSICTAVCLHRVLSPRLQFWYRIGFVVPMVVNSVVVALLWKMFYEPNNGILNSVLRSTGAMNVLVWMSGAAAWIGRNLQITTFFGWAGELFKAGENPNWLGGAKMVWLAVVAWGFPWVNVFGVLVYLAVLESIGKDVYEAAEVDGVNWFSKFRFIELPLILKQVRIMMFLVILSTINDASSMMIFVGTEGGPEGVLQVPAMYIFREAYASQMMGSACAIGIVLVLIIFLMNRLNSFLIQPTE